MSGSCRIRCSQSCQGATHALWQGGFVVDAGETHPDFKLAAVVLETLGDGVHARIQRADYDEGRRMGTGSEATAVQLPGCRSRRSKDRCMGLKICRCGAGRKREMEGIRINQLTTKGSSHGLPRLWIAKRSLHALRKPFRCAVGLCVGLQRSRTRRIRTETREKVQFCRVARSGCYTRRTCPGTKICFPY